MESGHQSLRKGKNRKRLKSFKIGTLKLFIFQGFRRRKNRYWAWEKTWNKVGKYKINQSKGKNGNINRIKNWFRKIKSLKNLLKNNQMKNCQYSKIIRTPEPRVNHKSPFRIKKFWDIKLIMGAGNEIQNLNLKDQLLSSQWKNSFQQKRFASITFRTSLRPLRSSNDREHT